LVSALAAGAGADPAGAPSDTLERPLLMI
jgi:hypothetical protein